MKDFKLTPQSGFTLMELLIAITLLAFMGTAIWQTLNNSIDTKERVLEDDRAYFQVQLALDRLQNDFNQLYSPLFSSVIKKPQKKTSTDSFYSEPKAQFKKSKNFLAETESSLPIPKIDKPDKGEIIFMTSSHRRKLENNKQSRYAWVRYFLRSSEDEQKRGDLELVRSVEAENIYRGDIDWEKVPQYTILKNIKELDFLLWESEKKKFVENIRTLGKNRDKLRSIQVNLTWISPTGEEKEFNRLFRVSWPFFDTEADWKIQEEAKKPQNNSQTGQTDPNQPPVPDGGIN